ncbi:MAG: hypothetical protein K6T85_09340, partial [Gorillibacterium sp.]|nr:hypothetical protein [Gorillibacterium sp.]
MKRLAGYRLTRHLHLPRFLRILIRLVLVIAIGFGAIRWLSTEEQIAFTTNTSASQLLDFKSTDEKTPYAQVLQAHPEATSSAVNAPVIEINPVEYALAAPEAKLETENSTEGSLLKWKNEAGWVEWTFTAPSAGWYELHLDYMPLAGGNTSVVRGIQIDGQYPFAESEHIELERHWKDAKYPYERNEIGMQVRPQQTEIVEWSVKAVSDYSVSSRPLLYQLAQGEHTLRFAGEREGVLLKAISFQPQKQLPTYAEYQAAQPVTVAEADWHQVTEAEQFMRKSSLSIQTDHWSEPYISPDPKGRITYNVLGGNRWRQPGEWVDWELTVPADGWYEIDLKNFQNYRSGFKAYRTIKLDGETP